MIRADHGNASTSAPSRSTEALPTQLALCALLLASAIGAVCWCGAQLAAILSGHGPMPTGVGSSGSALRTLPSHLSDPAAAWPVNVQGALPGPITYWTCTFIAAAIVVGGLTPLVLWWWRRSTRCDVTALGIERHAGFARAVDLHELLVKAPEPGRLTLGYTGHRLLAAERNASLAVIGPTGCGKTAGFAIPALLEWRGPIIATSVKADLIDASIEHRTNRGSVWIYDPTEASRHRSHCWSPLHGCRTWPGAIRTAAWLCEAAQPRIDTVNDGDYWYTQARRALAPYLYAAALSDRTMRDVVRWIDAQEQAEVGDALSRHGGVDGALVRLAASARGEARRKELSDRVYEEELASLRGEFAGKGDGQDRWVMQPVGAWPMDKSNKLTERVERALDQRITAEFAPAAIAESRSAGELDALITARSLWNKEPRLRGSVFATVENVLSTFADPGVARSTQRCDIDLDRWLTGDNTIYVVAPSHEQARLRPVLTVLVQQAFRRAYELANANGGALVHPCLALLDEAGNIAPLRDLPAYASTARSHGITLVSIWQDVAQLKALYGDRAQTVLNNHRAKLFGTGIADDGTLEYVSRLIGDERRTDLNISDDVRGGRRTINEHVSYRRTAPVDVLRRIRTNEAVLLYGSALPAQVRLRPWFAK